MDWKIFLTTFAALFVAEIGDKTQLAVICMVSDTRKPVAVFLGAVLALALATLIGVIFGGGIARLVPKEYIQKIAALLFVVLGILMFWGKI